MLLFLTACKCVEFLQLKWSFSTPHPGCPRNPRLSFICALHAAAAAPGESQRAGYNYCRPDYPKSAFPLAAAAAALSCGRCWRCMTRYSRTGVPSVTFSLTIWLFSYQLLLIVPRGDLFICRGNTEGRLREVWGTAEHTLSLSAAAEATAKQTNTPINL